MSTNHTPGPWTQHHNMPDCVTFEGKHGAENLFLENSRGYYACQSKEDASLISAAPELLAALNRLEESGWLNHIYKQADSIEPHECAAEIKETVKIAREAIAKAKGVST